MTNGKDKIPPEVQQIVDAAVAEVKAKSKGSGSVPAQPVRFKASDIHPDPEVEAPAREAAASKIIAEAVPDIDLGHEATRIDQEAQKVKVSDLKSADEIHAESMVTSPEYAAAYEKEARRPWNRRLLDWLRNQQGPSI